MKPVINVKKILLITFLVIVGVVIVALSTTYTESRKNKFGDEVVINKLEENTTDRPTPEKNVIDYIQFELLEAVNMNHKKAIKGSDITDAVVRSGSFNQQSKDNIYTVSFIVDIPSLKQSYQANYQWEEGTSSVKNIDEWGTNVRCLPEEKLIFGKFECKDMFSILSGDNSAIIRHLPHSTLNYRVTLDPKEKNTLNVVIKTSAADERKDSSAAVLTYKNQVVEWIRSTGNDPVDYKIKYSVIRASLY